MSERFYRQVRATAGGLAAMLLFGPLLACEGDDAGGGAAGGGDGDIIGGGGGTPTAGACEPQTIPGTDTVIKPTLCDAVGILEPGVGAAGSYKVLCDPAIGQYESLYELAAAFQDEIDLNCLAMEAGVALQSFSWEPIIANPAEGYVRDEYLANFDVAYLFVDDVFVGRIERINHSMYEFPACGMPDPYRRIVALEPGSHTFRLEAWENEQCTKYNNGGPTLCGDTNPDLDFTGAVGTTGSPSAGTCNHHWIGEDS